MEEETKAIEYLEKYIHWETFGERQLEADIETALNLIKKQQTKINALEMTHDYDVKMIDEVKGEAVKLYKEIDKLKRQIEIKDKYLELMWFLGADYDGMDTTDGLKSLIDELMDLVKKAGNNDDKCVVYDSLEDKCFNILYEEVEKENENG